MKELPDRFDINDLRVDLGLQRVKRGDTPIPLPKLSLDLLLALARSAPNLVSVDELMTRVWRGLVVNPETVSQRVKLLRDALGDEPRAPKYIESLRGRGYRLIPELIPADPLPTPSFPPPSQASGAASAAAQAVRAVEITPAALPHPAPQGAWRRWLVAVAAAVVTIGLIVGLAKGRQNRVPTDQAVMATGAPRRSVAVMPFEDLSVNHDGGQLALALPEMVLQRLGMVNDLVVIARSSSFSFTGQQLDAREIGRRLGAGYLVEGSLQRSGDRLRVAGRLVDARSGRQLQAWQFDRSLANVFDLQDEIAAQLAAGLKVQLLSVDLKRVDRSRGTSLDAYLTYLDSQELLNRWTVADADRAIVKLEHAIELDPAFALGYAELARARSVACFLRHPNCGPGGPEDMLATVNHALAIDPRLGEAYFIRASLERVMDAPKAMVESDFRKGVELAPNYGPGYEMYGEWLADQPGPQQEGMALIEHAILIDPIDPRNLYRRAFHELKDLHDAPAAEKSLLHVLEVAPNFPPAYVRLAQIRGDAGRLAEAVQFVEQALRVEPQSDWVKNSACALYLDLGDRRAAVSISSGAAADSERAVMIAAYDRRYGSVMSNRTGDSFTSSEASYAYAVSLMHKAVEAKATSATIAHLRSELGFNADGVGFTLPADATLGDPMTLAYLFKVQRENAPLANLLAAIEKVAPRWAAYSGHFKASVDLLKGDRDGAIKQLSLDTREGHWNFRWVFERDPVFEEIKNDARWRTLVEQDEIRLQGQRKLLEQMREDGQVPRR